MIKVDKHKISISGKAFDVISELTYAIVHICKRIAEDSDKDIEQVFANVGTGVMIACAEAIKAYKEEA